MYQVWRFYLIFRLGDSNVSAVQKNVTDIDDKIIKANERGMPFEEVSRHFEKEFMGDMEALNIRQADFATRVSEYVPDIIDYIQTIIDNGFAYENAGSAYFWHSTLRRLRP